ncbi:protein vreteno [Musca vetustissima]|uniref:protein vreteno n=1 Tax=Musca vetustissima TaxID=27455 RepID=UPI002AB67F6F|nr:protein vreteno [Musca vetustissima]
MSDDNLKEDFQKWNPMEKDYKSVEFNQYNTGPGANLDSSLQLANNNGNTTPSKDAPTPFLLFKNMPPKMSKTALRNICSKHGTVTSVRDSQKCDYFFVDFATVADMEATFRALENNNYGFQVFVGKHKKSVTPMDYNKENKIIPVPPRTTGIDYQNRTIRVPSKQLPRPKIEQPQQIDGDECNVYSADFFQNDAHQLEREGLHEPIKHAKFKYQTGRSYIQMSDNMRDFVTKKHKESSGRYSPSTGIYVNKVNGFEKPSKIGKCNVCKRECDTICSRCSVYYCSVDCQKSDWQEHRYICGKPKNLQEESLKHKKSPMAANKPMPAVKEFENTYNSPKNSHIESDCKSLIPRSGNIVTITAISKTNIVFIRAKTYEDNMSYFKTIDGIQAMGKKLRPLAIKPKCGNVVIAKFGDQYNRALVLNSDNPDKIFVNYMDYGNLDNLRLEDLYEAPIEYAEKPRHAMPVILKGVPDCYMTEEIRSFMYSYLNGINVYVKYKPEDYSKEKGVYHVELIDETTQQNLNKMIIKLSKPTEPLSTNEICYIEYLQQKHLPSGENVELIVMDNSSMSTGCVSCTTKPFALEIQKFQKDLQKYVESIPKEGYAPRQDELCIVKYNEDGLWYRGRCLEVVGDGYPTILFIDYGNVSMVHIDDIRRYPTQFTYPIYTADCEIQGLPESCNDEIVAKLEELIPHGSVIKCKNVKAFSDDHFYSISLPDVIQKLNKCGLLELPNI